MTDYLSTSHYKGVRDFYPEDMAVQRYIFDTWSKTAESFGYSRYDTSILEPADLYRAKGAENEEIVNDQTYTFTDRGGREVTLRPEMTPSVARMVAHKRHELTAPIRWYSIPNLFRYERPQRGRLREHWQLNCDIFGVTDRAAEVEIIALAYQLFIDLGATPDMFEIRVNNRNTMQKAYEMLGITDPDMVTAITRINDRKHKIDPATYREQLATAVGDTGLADEITTMIETPDTGDNSVVADLHALGITNARLDRSLARGFDYYTGTVFEIFDTASENNRAMSGGGRYDNLTGLFSNDSISGVGFGMGDVTMQDFLETHNLLPDAVRNTAPTVVIIPTDTTYHTACQKLAKQFRAADIPTSIDISDRKRDKKYKTAREYGTQYALVYGADEDISATFTLQALQSDRQTNGNLDELITDILGTTR